MERLNSPGRLAAGVVSMLGALVLVANLARAEEGRPTVQDRFASKKQTTYLQATTTTQIRNDFYDSVGVGADLGYYPSEAFGLEARWAYLFSGLNPAAVEVKHETGLTPDARPQYMLAALGGRYSFGYGKMLIGRENVVHFDPQLAFHGGVALAERRVLPTGTVAVSLLTHFQYGVQAKLDLGLAVQAERRHRGWVPSIGFMPTLGIGWGGDAGDLADLFSSGAEGEER